MREEKEEEPTISFSEKSATPLKKIRIDIYGEGTRLDVYGYDDNLEECHNALRDGEYYSITVFENGEKSSYSLEDLGSTIYSYEWPEDIFDEQFIDSAYTQYEGKEPSDVFDFGECDLYDAEDECIERIEMIQTKIVGSVYLELEANEKFDPKKLHFLYSEFVVPDAELEVNTAVVYNSKQYPIELDIESEREISNETIWEDSSEE